MNRTAELLRAIGLAICIYGLLAWLYELALIFYWCPLCIDMHFAHFVPIRNDTFSIFAFAASFVGFIVWRLSKE